MKFEKCEPGCTKHQRHVDEGTPIDAHGNPLDTKGQPITECIESVHDGGRLVSFHNCGRKLKGDARYPHLCGLHVSALDRAAKKERDRANHQKVQEARNNAVIKQAAAISTALEIKAAPQWAHPTTGPGAYIGQATGNAIVALSDLEALAAELTRLRAEVDKL